MFDPEVSIPSPAKILNACVFKLTLPEPNEAVNCKDEAIPVNPEPSPWNEPLAEPLNSPEAVTAVKFNLFNVVLVSPNSTTVLPKVKLEVAKDEVGKPPVLTCKVPPAPIITVLPSTATPNLFPLPPNKAPDCESAEEVISDSVIPCGFTLKPLAPASKVEPETWTETVAALLPSKLKSVIPLPSVKAFVNFEAVISPLNEPVNEPLNEPVPLVAVPLPVAKVSKTVSTAVW